MSGRQMQAVWLAALLMSSGVIAQQVDMSGKSLTEISEDAPTNITEWILSNNSLTLTALDVSVLQKHPRIIDLDLSYNRIRTLPPGAFDKLPNLKILRLRGNSLQTLGQDLFKELRKLSILDLKDNPWNCSCPLTSLFRQLNESGVFIGKEVSCDTPLNTAVLDANPSCSTEDSRANPTHTRSTPAATTTAPSSSPVNGSSKGLTAKDGETQTGSHSWKFLLGVVALTLSTSMLIVCAVKSPSWYKLLFNYRHQRLREDAEHRGRFSTFSLDTEQTDTSAQELDTGLSLQPFEEDDDGFIEDGYIEPGNYQEHTEASES